MSKRPGTNKENLEETRRIFLDIACKEFCEHGYASASTSRIVEQSGMARGSLYYHFGDKAGLFRAVYEETMQETLKHVSKAMDAESDPWKSFIAGSNSFLDLCMKDEFRKIVLIEAQAAMSFRERFSVQEKTLLGKLRTILPPLLERGHFPGHTPETIVIFIFGVLGEIGRAFDFSTNLKEDRENHGRAFIESMTKMVKT